MSSTLLNSSCHFDHVCSDILLSRLPLMHLLLAHALAAWVCDTRALWTRLHAVTINWRSYTGIPLSLSLSVMGASCTGCITCRIERAAEIGLLLEGCSSRSMAHCW